MNDIVDIINGNKNYTFKAIDNFKLEDSNVYFVGDGAGKAGNIVTAAATGLVAARDILKRSK